MDKASAESPSNICFRNIMAAFSNPPAHAGDSPRAISSAFRKRKHFTSEGRKSRANVVFPARLHPPMR